jgi:hypothetical protein
MWKCDKRRHRGAECGIGDDLKRGNQAVTVGADKGYDTKDFGAEARNLNVTPKH